MLELNSDINLKQMPTPDHLSWKLIVKSTMRTALSAYEKVKDGLAKTKEDLEDIAAEVRSEIQTERDTKTHGQE